MPYLFRASEFNINGLTAETTPLLADSVGFYDLSATATRKATIEQILTTPIVNATEKTTPTGNDKLLLVDSAASDAAKMLKWSTISSIGGTASTAPLNHTGRLSGLSNVAQPTTGNITATSIYLVPDVGGTGAIRLYNGSSWDSLTFSSQVTLSLSGQAVGFYDVYLYSNSGTLTLELLAWTSTYQKRATAVTTQDGVYVKSGATTRRLVGFIYVSSTGTVIQSRNCAENGLVSIQDMPEADNEFSFWGSHAGWMVPWTIVPMIRNAQSKGGTAPRLMLQRDSSGQGSHSAPIGCFGWSFREPYRYFSGYGPASSGSLMLGGIGDVGTAASNYNGSSTTPIIAFPNANITGNPRRMAYDPVGHKFYLMSGNTAQVYKWDPAAFSFSSPAGLNKNVGGWKTSGDMVLSQRKIFASDNTNVFAISPASDTFGSAGVTDSGNNGYNIAWNPYNDKIYYATGSQTVKVVDAAAETLTTTITLTANNYFGGGAIYDCIFCPTTKMVYVFGYANGDSVNVGRCVVINTSNAVERVIQLGRLFYPRYVDYVPGWDCFLMQLTTSNNFGTNDSSSSRFATLSPYAITPDPGTSWASSHTASAAGVANCSTGIFIDGATPTPGYFYSQSANGVWLPGTNQFKIYGGANASGATIYAYNLNPLWS